jgi:hypothetical protein
MTILIEKYQTPTRRFRYTMPISTFYTLNADFGNVLQSEGLNARIVPCAESVNVHRTIGKIGSGKANHPAFGITENGAELAAEY